MAKEIGVLQVGTVSIDGTKLKANASKHQSVTYKRCQELLPMLEEEVELLLKKAEEIDRQESEGGDRLPEVLARHENLKEKIKEAKRVLEEQALEKAKEEQSAYLEPVRKG